jgi:murein DD-endopeptidase MepM/ murein hydrolase activator NlpD
MFRWLVAFVFIVVLVGAATYVAAGRGAPPRVTIDKPDRFVGQKGSLEVTAEAPDGRFSALAIALEQNGRRIPLFTLLGDQAARVTQVDRNRIHISRELGKQAVPELQPGAARIVVTATRPSFLNLRPLTSRTTKDVQVQLEPPRLAIVSSHHHVNHGGSEMILYRATPSDVRSGVRVGDFEYPGYPAGVGADANTRVAFFALLHDQDLNVPIVVFARDEAGNESKLSFIDNVFEKPFKRSRIQLDDKFLQRVVPEILEHAPELKMTASEDLLPAFLKINGQLRQANAEAIAKMTANSSPARLWAGPFVQLGNSQVEASFADHRAYFYKGKEVDQQVHLGFDLAVTRSVPVVAANAGKVLNASWLGIYGNCIIIDHGWGVASLYGHLSSFDVRVGDSVTRGQTIGRSGMTGLAGGDHLHFTMLVNGHAVNPVEWWDPHWIQDRVERKLQEAGPSTRETTASRSLRMYAATPTGAQ